MDTTGSVSEVSPLTSNPLFIKHFFPTTYSPVLEDQQLLGGTTLRNKHNLKHTRCLLASVQRKCVYIWVEFLHRYFSVIGMQERADISDTPEVFLLMKFLVKESLRCMISIHTAPHLQSQQRIQVSGDLYSRDMFGEQEVNKGSCWKPANRTNKKPKPFPVPLYVCGNISDLEIVGCCSWILPVWPTLSLAIHLTIRMVLEISNVF